MTDGTARAMPDAAPSTDAVAKTFVEGTLLLALAGLHFAIGLSAVAILAAMALLLAGSIAADKYLFGSIGRAMAERRALHFKMLPFVVAALLIFLLFPAEAPSDRIVRFALAAGIGGIVTGLLNLGKGRPADA